MAPQRHSQLVSRGRLGESASAGGLKSRRVLSPPHHVVESILRVGHARLALQGAVLEAQCQSLGVQKSAPYVECLQTR